jgi:acyl carrier protein
MLREQVARVLGASAEKLDLDRPLTDLGLDSLMAVELRNWIEGDLRLSLPTVELMKGPSVSRLAELLLAQLAKIDAGGVSAAVVEIRRQPDEATSIAQTEELLAQVDGMSDEQVEAMLREMAPEEKEATG